GVLPCLLVRGGEVAVPLRGMILDLGRSLGDRAAPAAAEETGELLAEAAAAARADAHENEAQPEDDGEHRVYPLLVAPQTDEENLRVGVPAAAVSAPAAGTRLRRLCLRLCLLFRLDCCSGHQPPRVAEAGATFALRRSKVTASQIDPSNSSHIGRSSRNVVT